MGEIDYRELNKESFMAYIADPSALGTNDAVLLEKALEKFPYCQTLQLFYTRSLFVSDSPGLDKQLARTALVIPDRTVLHSILNEAEKLRGTRNLKETVDTQKTLSDEVLTEKLSSIPVDSSTLDTSIENEIVDNPETTLND